MTVVYRAHSRFDCGRMPELPLTFLDAFTDANKHALSMALRQLKHQLTIRKRDRRRLPLP